MNKMILETKNLTKIYKSEKVVNEINLEVPENTIYGLLGPNGAGKSTTLKMITGIARPTKGVVLYKGRPWERNDLSEIGALIESPPIYGNLTAYENLLTRVYSLGLQETRIKEVLELVDLTNTGKKKARQFSMGMKQRLGIALALIGSPKLLVLDEPTNGLDPLGIQSLRLLIRSLPERGISVIYSSHILSEVENTVDEIGIITNGKLGYQGKLPENSEELEQLFMKVVKDTNIERRENHA